MNIFILSYDPDRAAIYQCDRHTVKMILEQTQILCTTINKISGITTPYKPTHVNHPCSIWVRSSDDNWNWALKHAYALSKEYTFRYGRIHKSHEIIEWCDNNKPTLPNVGLTPFAQAMPDTYKNDDAVTAYRAYYKGEKAKIAKWNKTRSAPHWW